VKTVPGKVVRHSLA